MSNWTHVAGIIRVDCIRGLEVKPDFAQIFGKELHWGSTPEEWEEYATHPEGYLPSGSEGSLTITVWDNPKKSHIAAYTVSIFGDLRDHENSDEIIEWFKDKCAKLRVRNACIVAENEHNGVRHWVYAEE